MAAQAKLIMQWAAVFGLTCKQSQDGKRYDEQDESGKSLISSFIGYVLVNTATPSLSSIGEHRVGASLTERYQD